jgi:hypothetical protein
MIIPPDRFKRCYHRFAPELEINQMVSSNPYYVLVSAFYNKGAEKKFV